MNNTVKRAQNHIGDLLSLEEGNKDDAENAITNLLVGILHTCDGYKIDFNVLMEYAHEYHGIELRKDS